MEIDRETALEIGVSVGAVLLMFVAMIAVGATYTRGGELTQLGGQLLVGVIVAFVLLMFAIGQWLSRVKN